MSIFTKIETATTAATSTDRGNVKTLILALKSYAKHSGQHLSAKAIANIVREYIPMAKTTANSVADYQNKLNSGLYDYYSLADATTILQGFEDAKANDGMTYGNIEETTETAENVVVTELPKSPWSADDIIYNRGVKKTRKSTKK